MNDAALRAQLRALLDWSDAHANFDRAVEGVPPEVRGRRIDNFPHSLWELLEHIRIAQADILDFCRNPDYRELEWPREYWPTSPEPPSAEAWEESVRAVVRDRAMLQALMVSPEIDPGATIPHGTGQTYLREALLVADHTAYHVGQIVALRRILGVWQVAS